MNYKVALICAGVYIVLLLAFFPFEVQGAFYFLFFFDK